MGGRPRQASPGRRRGVEGGRRRAGLPALAAGLRGPGGRTSRSPPIPSLPSSPPAWPPPPRSPSATSGRSSPRATAWASIPPWWWRARSTSRKRCGWCAVAASSCRKRCRWAWARWPRSSASDLAVAEEACVAAAQGEVVGVANINSPGQIVIAGHRGAVERAVKAAAERGGKKSMLLPVSAPFHCALMKPAADRLAAELERRDGVRAALPGGPERRCRGHHRRRGGEAVPRAPGGQPGAVDGGPRPAGPRGRGRVDRGRPGSGARGAAQAHRWTGPGVTRWRMFASLEKTRAAIAGGAGA